MSAFNTLSAKLKCPSCKAEITVPVQFKYGDTWQISYEIGDRIAWGGNDVGEQGKHHVVVDGVVALEKCPACASRAEWNVYVHIEKDRITRVENADGRLNFGAAGRNFIVCD